MKNQQKWQKPVKNMNTYYLKCQVYLSLEYEKIVESCHYLIMGKQEKTSNIVDLKIKKKKNSYIQHAFLFTQPRRVSGQILLNKVRRFSSRMQIHCIFPRLTCQPEMKIENNSLVPKAFLFIFTSNTSRSTSGTQLEFHY